MFSLAVSQREDLFKLSTTYFVGTEYSEACSE